MTEKTTSIKYRPEIDGLRTIAVIPVIFFHLGYSFVKGGFYGVDVFFVISGYLITKILTENISHGKFSMYQFWIRRVKRLLPLLLTVVLTTLIVAFLFVFKPVIKDLSKDIFPAIFSYSNFHALYDFGDYWGSKAEQSFFLHTWSLSVEEQFYLIYPIFLFISYKFFKNYIIPISVITIVSLFLFFFYAKIFRDVDTAFYMLPTRIWELSIGGLSGLVQFQKFRNLKIQKLLPLIGIIFMTLSYIIGYRELWIFPVIGASLIILFCTPNDITGKILSTKLFVFVGKLSYSLYLWHWCIIVLFKTLEYQLHNINHHLINGLILLLTILFANLSHTFIENKTRNYTHTPKIVLGGIALITALTLFYRYDLFNPYYNSKYNQQKYFVNYYDITPRRTVGSELKNSLLGYNVIMPNRLSKYNEAYKTQGIISNANGIPEIMLLGDSHGVMWAKTFNEIADELNITASTYTSNGTSPFFNVSDINQQVEIGHFTKTERIEYAKSILTNIEKWSPKLIVFACRWEAFDTYESQKLINDFLTFLEEKNIKVLILTQPPVLHFMTDKNASQYFTYLGMNPTTGYNLIDVDNTSVIKANQYINSIKTNHNNVMIYDVYYNMMQNNKVKISLGKEVLYFDDDHLSYYGTFVQKKNISKIVDSAINDGKTK